MTWAAAPVPVAPTATWGAPPDEIELRLAPGPRSDWFDDDARVALFDGEWTVAADADRVGVRLDGPVLTRRRAGELPSEGMVPGALQVAPTGRPTVLLADGNVGLGGDPERILRRAGELLRRGGRCIAEFDSATTGINVSWVRLESQETIGPWFRWASVGIDCVPALAARVGLAVADVHPIGQRVVASLVTR